MQHHNNKLWNDKRRPKFSYTKNDQTLIDLVYTLNFKRVYAEHKICMGKYNWRSRIAEIEGYSILRYSNDPAPASAHNLNGWVPRPETSDGALSGKVAGSSSGRLKRVRIPPFQVQAAAEELRSARYRLEDTVDAINHERRRVAAVKGHQGKVFETKLYQPSNDRNRTPPLPKKGWMLLGDARAITTHVVIPSKLCFELMVDGSVIKSPATKLTPLEVLAQKQMRMVDAGFDAFDLVFEKYWERKLNASAKLVEPRISHPVGTAPMSPPPSPPVSRKSSPTKPKSSTQSGSPTKSKSKSPTKMKKVEARFPVKEQQLTVSEILSQRAQEQRQRAKQEQGVKQGQQQVLDLGQQVQLKQPSLDTGSDTGSGRGRQQKRPVSPLKADRGRATMVPQWQEDSMKTVRREISP